MNLTSCENCGIVLNKDKLHFAENIYNEEGIDETIAAWNGDKKEFLPYVSCPVCGEMIWQ